MIVVLMTTMTMTMDYGFDGAGAGDKVLTDFGDSLSS